MAPPEPAASAAPFIQTVAGRIPPQALGQTLAHEHLLVDWPWALGQTRERCETRAVIDYIVSVLNQAHAHGIRACVDVGTELFGPSPMALIAIAAQTPVHIVCSTGCFAQDMLPPPWWVYPPATPRDIAARFIQAATHGQKGSGVKPGVIKIATSGEMVTTIEKNVFIAAAMAQRETGLAITTHAFLTRWAEEQVDILEEAGADLDRVIIGHIGWGSTRDDKARHAALLKRGVNIGVDIVASPARSTEECADIIADLVEAGHGKQIVVSHDRSAFSRGLRETFGPDWMSTDFTEISRSLAPALEQRGVDARTIQGLLADTPCRILTIDPARYPNTLSTLCREEMIDPRAPYDYSARMELR